MKSPDQWVEVRNMKGAREAQRLTQAAAAEQAHVSVKTWQRWERAGRVPAREAQRVQTILRLRKAFVGGVLVEPYPPVDLPDRLHEWESTFQDISRAIAAIEERLLARLLELNVELNREIQSAVGDLRSAVTDLESRLISSGDDLRLRRQ